MSRTSAVIICTGLLLQAGCGEPRRGDTSGALAGDTIEAIVIGEAAAAALRNGLVGRLGAAIEAGGPAGAIDVCALEALPLTDSIARSTGGGIRIKRTAARIRNPANSADSLEQTALDWFVQQHERGARPDHLLQRTPDGFRYYAPLRVAELCLNCHGNPDAMSAEVMRALAERYPADQATGYATGDFRGLIRVSVPRSALTGGDDS